MVLKRHFRDDEGSEDVEFPVPESKRRPNFRDVVRDVMRDATLNERESERFFRGIVREEVERSILPLLVSSPNVSRPPLESGSTSGGCGLQLRFINKLPSTIFTGSKVEAENGTPLQIELVDASTGAIVRSGPLSSLKIELLVVNGDCGSDDQEDWTEQEFNNYIVHARDGRRPLVTGETHVTLREGVGFVGDVVFTDNSSWIRSRKFRLAARVVAKSPSEARIREARSEPFVVKDHRGELYKKHYPPHLNDEIWRLEKIAKDGAFHKSLCENGISTVEDFLQLYMRDASLLRNAFGVISNKIWETIIEHAMACKLDDHKCYAYQRAEHDVSLMFNSVHRLVGAIINGQFCSLDELDGRQKMLVETLKQHAYRNVRDLVPVNVSTIFGLSMPLPCPQAETASRTFRLAARVVAKSSSEVRIREARSEPFVVKDHRGELYKKHYPPHLNDEIWRLERIAKDGAFHKRLCENGISTVEDFLQLYMRDASSLRNAFGLISNKVWETIIEHAMACKLDDHKFYAFHTAEGDVSLIFNSIHRLVAAIINGQFCSLDELNAYQMMLVETLKQHAYQNVNDLILVDASTIFGLSRPLPCLQAEQFTSPNPDLQQIQFPFTHQDELPIQLGFNHGSASTSSAYQAAGSSNQLMVSLAQSQPMQLRSNSFSVVDSNSVIYSGERSWPPLSGFQAPILPTGHLGTENLFQVEASTWSPANPIWGQAGGFYFTSGSEAEAAHFPLPAFVHNAGARRKAKACWCKLRAAVKWMSVGRHARPYMFTRRNVVSSSWF